MADLQGREDSLVPYNPAASRRVLLPAEAELCNALGLTEEEYWYFVELTDAYNGKRDEAYELAGVPDVRNDPVSIIIQLVIGIALSAIGMLLAPKPKQQQTPPQLKTADSQGARRYTTNSGFESSQELASLGEVVPPGVRQPRGECWRHPRQNHAAVVAAGELRHRPAAEDPDAAIGR